MEVEDDLGAEEVIPRPDRAGHDRARERAMEHYRRDRAPSNTCNRGDRRDRHGRGDRQDRGHERGEARRYGQRDHRPRHHDPRRN